MYRGVYDPYSAKATRAAAPSNPMPISGLAAASGVEVGVAVPTAEATMFDAEATAAGSGFDATAVQISGARVVSLLWSSEEQPELRNTQGPMELMKSCFLSPQRQVKSSVAHPISDALLAKQPEAHDGNWETRSGSVEF